MSHGTTAEANAGGLTVRRGEPRDAPALAELRYAFRTTDFTGGASAFEDLSTFLPRCTEWMRARLATADGPWRCWVSVEENGRLGGALWLETIEKVPNPAREEPELHAYVTNVYVRPELRGRGIASALLERALACCRELGIDQVILWPSELSRPLYTRHGFAVSDGVLVARPPRPR